LRDPEDAILPRVDRDAGIVVAIRKEDPLDRLDGL
jgi:hypothetical protein